MGVTRGRDVGELTEETQRGVCRPPKGMQTDLCKQSIGADMSALFSANFGPKCLLLEPEVDKAVLVECPQASYSRHRNGSPLVLRPCSSRSGLSWSIGDLI